MTEEPNLAPSQGQERPRHRWWPRGVWPNVLIALAALGFLTGACLDACTQMNTIRRVPAIHGRVVDMETGQPVPGVQVTRWFERGMIVGPGGSDTYRVKGSLRTVTSDAAGSFEFPVWYGFGRGISSIEWTEYKPGWVAAWGNLSLVATPPTFLVARMKGDRTSVQIDTQRAGWALAVTMKLHRVDTPTAAEDHFWALRLLVERRVIPEEHFVSEAEAYANSHKVTPEIFAEFSKVESTLGGHDLEGRPCYKAALALTLQKLREHTCQEHPEWSICEPTTLRWRRSFLERACGTFRR